MTTSEHDIHSKTFDADSSLSRARALTKEESSDHVLRCGEPSLFDIFSARMLTTVTLAVVAVALVQLDAAREPGPMDALDLALRMFALTATFRALVEVGRSVARMRRQRRARGSAVVLLDDALVVLGTEGSRVIPRERVASVHGGKNRMGDEELIAFLRPPEVGAAIVLPASATVPAQVAASRIGRWIEEFGQTPSATSELPHAPPSRDPAADYDRIAGGGAKAYEVAVPTSLSWLERGPYAALAFVLVLAERSMHLPEDTRLSTPVFALATLCVLLPLTWLANGFSRARTMRGAALVCTEAELLVRHPKGVHRAPWADVSDVRVQSRKSWTLLAGVGVERFLVVERVSHASVTFDERILGWSAPAVRALIDAYCSGHIAPSATPASQGSGAGGGISGTASTTT